MCSSPRLFAAYRVFHRLPVPGHPPCALLCLTSCTLQLPASSDAGRLQSKMVLTHSRRRICGVCPSCSLVLLAIAFSIYIRVIDSNFFYQRRGLMFDVFSIQFSRYGLAHTRYVLPAFCTPSASRNVLTGSFLTAHRMQSMVLYKAWFYILKQLRAAPFASGKLPHR